MTHIISDRSLMRADYSYSAMLNGAFIGWPTANRPEIIWDQIDGPLLHFRNGELHWLTAWERFRCWLGLDDAFTLERKHRPVLSAHDAPRSRQSPSPELEGLR